MKVIQLGWKLRKTGFQGHARSYNGFILFEGSENMGRVRKEVEWVVCHSGRSYPNQWLTT